MRSRLLFSTMSVLLVAGCGGGGENGSSNPIAVAPTPTPSPSPTSAPTPTPTPAPNPPSPLPGTGTGTIEFLHVFGIDELDGAQPNGPLLFASDGNFYGTTRAGGGKCGDPGYTAGCGVIFRATPDGVTTVLHRFTGAPGGGSFASSALVQGRDGALYGTTLTGGANNRGIAFRLGLDGAFRVLHNFGATSESGDRPTGALVQASDGNFYGATIGGGPNRCSGDDCGTIFRLTTAGDHQVIYSFGSRVGDGAVPNGSLLIGDDGALYGTTVVGGDPSCSDPALVPNIAGCGTVFRITTSGQLATLKAFGPTTSGGIIPQGGLVRGADGALYGATRGGGSGQCINDTGGCGTIFRITPSGVFSTIYEFSTPATRLPGETLPGSDGFNPTGNLWLGRDGNLYGSTSSGGVSLTSQTGTLFSLTTSGVKTILYRFATSQDGPAVPVGGLVEGANGVFWGVTTYNGKLGVSGNRTGGGTLFRITAPRRP